MDVFHIAIGAEHEAHGEFVTGLEGTVHRLELGALGGVHLGVKLLGELQRGILVWGDLGDVFHVLPMHAAPGDAFVVFLELNIAVAGLHFAA